MLLGSPGQPFLFYYTHYSFPHEPISWRFTRNVTNGAPYFGAHHMQTDQLFVAGQVPPEFDIWQEVQCLQLFRYLIWVKKKVLLFYSHTVAYLIFYFTNFESLIHFLKDCPIFIYAPIQWWFQTFFIGVVRHWVES